MLNIEFDRSFRATGNGVVTWCDVGCRNSSEQFQDTTDSAMCSRAPLNCVIGSFAVVDVLWEYWGCWLVGEDWIGGVGLDCHLFRDFGYVMSERDFHEGCFP